MPGYIIHMVEGRILEKQLPDACRKDPDWIRNFRDGILLPDSVRRADKVRTHFWSDKDQGHFIRTPDLELFLQTWGAELSDPMILGYFAHLHLDVCFFEQYILKIIKLLDENQQEVCQTDRIRMVRIRDEEKLYPLMTVFSADYLYGDYTKLNPELMEQYHLTIPSEAGAHVMEEAGRYFREFPFVPLDHLYQELRQIAAASEQMPDRRLKLLRKEELLKLLNQAAGAFCEFPSVKNVLMKETNKIFDNQTNRKKL